MRVLHLLWALPLAAAFQFYSIVAARLAWCGLRDCHGPGSSLNGTTGVRDSCRTLHRCCSVNSRAGSCSVDQTCASAPDRPACLLVSDGSNQLHNHRVASSAVVLSMLASYLPQFSDGYFSSRDSTRHSAGV